MSALNFEQKKEIFEKVRSEYRAETGEDMPPISRAILQREIEAGSFDDYFDEPEPYHIL